uniref:Uncharacterized protein n=1 Tax=Musca domestica TaxID=7370 RepID=A0A1I8NL77_MUSDO
MCGCQSYAEFRNKKSSFRRRKQGVPQDSREIITYADDCTLVLSGPIIDDICDRLNYYIVDLTTFSTARNMKISATKSTATFFNTWTAEMMDVQVDGVVIPNTNYSKVLEVTFDSIFKSSAHTTAICDKIKSRNKVLRSLASSTWRDDKETLLILYNAIGRSVVNYAAAVWSANVVATQWKNIQSCLNSGHLRKDRNDI